MSAWAVGRNMPGYLPETDVVYFRTWKAARECLEDEMRSWAQDEDADVEAHVGAIFAADGPAAQLTPDRETGAFVEDADGRMWAWWIAPVDESDVDEYVWGEED